MPANIHLQIEGVEGEAQDSGHEGWIDVLSWGWGLNQSGTMHTGGGGGAGKVQVSDLSVTKSVDKASPTLMLKCCKGEHIPSAELHLTEAGGDQQTYMKIKLKKVLVASVSPGGSGTDDKPVETLSLNFEEVAVDYSPQKEDGSLDAAVTMNWNIPKNTDA